MHERYMRFYMHIVYNTVDTIMILIVHSASDTIIKSIQYNKSI